MKEAPRILVPVDFSAGAGAVAKHALFWATRLRAELHFLHVWRIPWYLNENALIRTDDGEQTLRVLAHDKAISRMDSFFRSIAMVNNLPIRTTVTSGTPRNEILNVAGRRGNDLIIMGTRGRTGLVNFFLGSTAEGVLRRAPCPVLTVRETAEQATASTRPPLTSVGGGEVDGGATVTKILVPVEFGECSQGALVRAVELSKLFNASIEVLHVVELPHFGTPLMPSAIGDQGMDLFEFAVSEAKRTLAEILRPFQAPGIAMESTVVQGLPHEEILTAAERRKHDLVITGTHCRRGVPRFFLGSVAEEIVRRAPCPVLTVGGPGRAVMEL